MMHKNDCAPDEGYYGLATRRKKDNVINLRVYTHTNIHRCLTLGGREGEREGGWVGDD